MPDSNGHRSPPRIETHPTWMEFDLDALADNFRETRRRVGPDVKIIASLKANAYGHGAAAVARALEPLGVHAFATGSFADATAIRAAGVGAKILMFAGNTPEGVEDLLRLDLMPTVYNMETAVAVSKAARGRATVYVKVDGGLGRLGVPLDRAAAFIRYVAALPGLEVEGVYTHLPFGDAAGRAWAVERLERFHALVAALETGGPRVAVTQAIASAGIVTGVEDRCSAVCPGHLLYGGLSGVKGGIADYSGFRPALTAIRTRLIHVGWKAAGQAIGMGGYIQPKHDCAIGVVPLGLFDGMRKPAAGESARMLVRGRRAPLVSVSLEYSTIDLTGLDDPRPGEPVTVLGEDGAERIALEDIAAWQRVAPLEVLMTFDRRLPACYLRQGRRVWSDA